MKYFAANASMGPTHNVTKLLSRAAERGEQEGQIAPGPQGIRGLIIEDF